MYKEKFGDERFVDFSVEQSYTMNSELLDEWSSKQKFDVQIDAISAWNIVSRNRTGLFAPTKPPSSVRNLKIYATQQKTVDGARALIDLFWDEPTQWNGEPIGYIVNCSTDGTDELHSEELPPTVRTYSFSVKSGRISCIVGARNDPYLGTFSDPIDIDSSGKILNMFLNDEVESFFLRAKSPYLLKRPCRKNFIQEKAIFHEIFRIHDS
ncbi:unnamed protein product [Anisakis simplex]|uniref:Ig-like domain-containing protein n=1 Tax=Anisakis simplex TaxID=6269 RepID=A0A0M3JEI4_ANISI|nr:unnamed protein product [Anisakis simplex]